MSEVSSSSYHTIQPEIDYEFLTQLFNFLNFCGYNKFFLVYNENTREGRSYLAAHENRVAFMKVPYLSAKYRVSPSRE